MNSATDDFSQWIGRSESVADEISPVTAQAAAATFDQDAAALTAGAELPPLWHWFYFLPRIAQSRLGADGHPQREGGSFMPPIPLPRRMFAGARLKWRRPLVLGQPARREAVIRDVVQKTGRSGRLAFVTVSYRYLQTPADPSDPSELCVEEEQDIVYREPGPALKPPELAEMPALPPESSSRMVTPDSRLLFRFSALTFNAHRIHYDRVYATSEEGYPGLVVHGPLTAMLLLQLGLENTSHAVETFRFRSQSPLFDSAPFRLVAVPTHDGVQLQAQGPNGKTTMTAMAEFGKRGPEEE